MHACIHTYTHTYRQTDIHTDRQTYIHTYIHTYIYAGTGGDLETQWSTDTSECDQCASTAMRPACAKPSSCPRSDGDVPELCHEDDGLIHEDGVLVAVIAVIIGLSVIVSLVMAFRRLCRQRQKVEVQVPPMQPMPAHAQMQAQPAHVMQGIQVQAQMQPPGVLHGASLAR